MEDIERYLHQKFDEYRVRGLVTNEWFEREPVEVWLKEVSS
jgi:hypothetical protein